MEQVRQADRGKTMTTPKHKQEASEVTLKQRKLRLILVQIKEGTKRAAAVGTAGCGSSHTSSEKLSGCSTGGTSQQQPHKVPKDSTRVGRG